MKRFPVMLGNGSSTPSEFRQGNSTRRQFRPLAAGGSPCEKVNFRVYDFVTGNLLWQRLIREPVIATNGDIYAVNRSNYFDMFLTSIAATSSATVSSLPDQDYTPTAKGAEISFDRFDGTTGDLLGNSGLYEVQEVDPADDAYYPAANDSVFDLRPSYYQVNAAGNRIFANSQTPVAPIGIRFPNDGSSTFTYYLNLFKVTAATMTLTMAWDGGADVGASFDVDDSAATVETALTTAWGSHADSVTVTGSTLHSSGLKIVVEWTDTDRYITSYGCSYSAGSTHIGGHYLRNLKTGLLGTVGNSTTFGITDTARGRFCWSGEDDVWIEGKKPVLFTDITRLYMCDATADPWTVTWSKDPWETGSSDDTPVDTEISGGLLIKELVANATYAGVAVPFVADFSNAGQVMSVAVWAASDGTGETTNHASGTPLGGHLPYGLNFEDGGNDVAMTNQIWRDLNAWEEWGNTSLVNSKYSGNRRDWMRLNTSLAIVDGLNLGDFNERNLTGFNDTHVAFSAVNYSVDNFGNDMNSTGSNATISRMLGGPTGSGILNEAVEVDYWELTYRLQVPINGFPGGGTEWRLTFEPGESTEISTDWLDMSTTVAELDTELSTVFGVDADGNRNVWVIDDAGPGISAVPAYQRSVIIGGRGAKNSTDQTAMETPAAFIFGNGLSDAEDAYSLMPELEIELRNTELARTALFGSINQSDGTEAWAKNWSSRPGKNQTYKSILHDGRLYVFGLPVCVEEYPGILVEDPTETTTPPYGPFEDATFDISFTNYSGAQLSSPSLSASHDGVGMLNSPTMPSTVDVGETVTIELTYTPAADMSDVELTIQIGTSNIVTATVDIDEII